VLPFKSKFRHAVRDKKKFCEFIYNYGLKIENCRRPLNSDGTHMRDRTIANFKDLVRENTTKIEGYFKEYYLGTEKTIDEILKIYDAVDNGIINGHDGFDILAEDPYEKIVEKEMKETIKNRKCKALKRTDMPITFLEIILPFNALEKDEEQSLSYMDLRAKSMESGILARMPLKPNTLGIVYREREVCHLMDYVNHRSSHEFYVMVIKYFENQEFPVSNFSD